MPIILTVLIIAAALFAAAFFYVSRIISTLPKGRAEEQLQIQDSTNKKLIACIGDSLTHGNIGQSWVDYLREEFPNDIFLMRVLMLTQHGKFFKDLNQYLNANLI